MFKTNNLLIHFFFLVASTFVYAVDAQKQDHQTNFGVVSESYAAGRKGYSEGVYQTIQKYLKPQTCIIDVCCGTGISSRELYDHGFVVIGVDRDPKMIEQALQVPGYSIPYILFDLTVGLQNTSSVPKEAAAITAFTGFHWFHDSETAIDGIYETLQNDGYFIIVSGLGFKRGLGDTVQAEIERAIAEEIGPLPEKTVDLAASFKGRFKIIEEASIPVQDSYTATQYFHLMKSRNYWDEYRGTETEKRIERKSLTSSRKEKMLMASSEQREPLA